jgi:hypothetical protein
LQNGKILAKKNIKRLRKIRFSRIVAGTVSFRFPNHLLTINAYAYCFWNLCRASWVKRDVFEGGMAFRNSSTCAYRYKTWFLYRYGKNESFTTYDCACAWIFQSRILYTRMSPHHAL